MAAADAAAVAAGTSGAELMARAGLAVADAICARHAPRPTAVLCGPGNNGGDGYVVARILAERGWEVWVERLAPPAAADAKAAAAQWTGDTFEIGEAPVQAELFVDALFGAGLSKPLDGEAARLARTCERIPDRVVAIDLPSGLAGDTGRVLGDVAFCAALTVTFHAKKPAHVLEPGAGRCGDIVVADIGLITEGATLLENTPELWLPRFPWPDAAAHKHSRGRLVVVSGEAWNTGAARLSARAGLRMGAGVVTLLSPTDALAVNAAHLEAVMLRGFDTEVELEQL
ncbi:MAG: NAD(P)H-hydrate epimerase, partial [Phenylobacterium sp.]|nr:NAD(P)H-hydrate epimerase [Phenylobacterium sp.]